MTDTKITYRDQLRAQQKQELVALLLDEDTDAVLSLCTVEAMAEHLLEWYEKQPQGFITLHMDHGKEVHLNVRDLVHFNSTYGEGLDTPGSSLTWQMEEEGERFIRRGTVRESCVEIFALLEGAKHA